MNKPFQPKAMPDLRIPKSVLRAKGFHTKRYKEHEPYVSRYYRTPALVLMFIVMTMVLLSAIGAVLD